MAKSTDFLSQIKPTAGYVFIEPKEQAKQTSSGIYLPDSASGDKPQQGTVISIGDNEITDSGAKKTAPAKKGDMVIYKKWGGNEVKFDNKEYLFVKFEDILAVI
jgi:chaperonin GroES